MAYWSHFDVYLPNELSAGIRAYSNTITIKCEFDPTGEEGEFQKYMQTCLSEWFDGAKVTDITNQAYQEVED